MTWSPGDPFGDIMKQMIRDESDTKPIEFIICGHCNKLNSKSRIRRILDAKNVFIGYRCIDCAVEGKPLP